MGNLKVTAVHKKGEKLSGFDNNANLCLVMVDHHLRKAPENPFLLNNKPTQYVANSVRQFMQFNLYFVDGSKGVVTPATPTAALEALENAGDSENPSLWKLNLKRSYSKTNNGKATDNRATLVNKFSVDFPAAKVRFVMPKGHTYAVSSGTIEQQFDGNQYRAVDVSLPLHANSTAQVTISRAVSSTLTPTPIPTSTRTPKPTAAPTPKIEPSLPLTRTFF